MLYTRNLRPIFFWPYTSGVMDRIFECEFTNGDAIDRWRDELIAIFQGANIKCAPDNKIVFEFLDEITDKPFFIGFYDLKMSMGHSVRSDASHHEKRDALKKTQAEPEGQGFYVCVRCGKKSHPLEGPNHNCPGS